MEIELVRTRRRVIVAVVIVFGRSMEQTARIQFKQLKGFPQAIEEKIETEVFIAASNEIIDVIRKCCLQIYMSMYLHCRPLCLLIATFEML